MAVGKPAPIKATTKTEKASEEPKSTFQARSFFLLPFTLTCWLTKRFPFWLKWPTRISCFLLIVGLLTAVATSIVYYGLACTYDLKNVRIMPARIEILDCKGNILKNSQGKEIGYLHGKNRRLITYDEVTPDFINALIAQEDARFRSHGAVDYRAFARVIFRALTRGKLEGGGTITMQLARNSFTLKKPGETIFQGVHRKILETFIAFRIEETFEKNEILEHYMNRIFWGGSIRGIEVAAMTYFGKPAKSLSLSESALLSGIIRAPNRFNPFKNLESSRIQRDWVLSKMLEHNFITQNEAEQARSEPIQVASSNKNFLSGSYALDAIRRDLDRILEEENIRDGGLIIQTTVDPNLQEIAEKSLNRRLLAVEKSPGYRHQKRSSWDQQGDPNYLQGAAVVIDNHTGAVLAIVGGRDATESQFNRALQAFRPIGSLFKPFVFLAAFDQGLKPSDLVSDLPIMSGEIPGAEAQWSPINPDGQYHPEITVAQALIESRNTSSIRVGSVAGLDKVIQVARSAGFRTDKIHHVPSSYLGSWGGTPEMVASAYTIFPNGGSRFRPYYIESIKDREGNVLFQNGPIAYQATDEQSAQEVNHLLEEVNRSGTGRAIRTTHGFQKPSGGKTGSSHGSNDSWYAGYTSTMTCAVWVGMDYGEVITTDGSGSRIALPIWADIMKAADRLPRYQNTSISSFKDPLLPSNTE